MEVGDGVADDMVEDLGKDAKIVKISDCQMMLVLFLWEGGCQELQNELNNVKIRLQMN